MVFREGTTSRPAEKVFFFRRQGLQPLKKGFPVFFRNQFSHAEKHANSWALAPKGLLPANEDSEVS
jgi:trehalose utilization protein